MRMMRTVMVAAMVAGCGTATPAGKAEVALQMPEAVKAGDNDLSVMLMQDGKPIDDAKVSVEFQMPAMPQMNMAEMKNSSDLASAGGGLYRGKGQVVMAGTWNVTVMAMKNGQAIASQKLAVTAK